MNFDEFQSKIAILRLTLTAKGIPFKEVDTLITKSSGETLFCLLHDEKVIDYFKM